VLSRAIKNKSEQLFKGDEGSGSWTTFFDCPRINIAEKTGNYQDQGSAKIYAKNIVDPTSNEDKLGVVLEFKQAPGALLKKIATLVSGNKYYKIELPYKAIGFFINDEEGRKIASAINSSAITAKNIVRDLKSNINGEVSGYIEKKRQLDAAQKGKEELEKVQKAQEQEANAFKTKIESRKAEVELQKKQVNEQKLKVAEEEAKLQKLLDSLNVDTAKLNNLVETAEKQKANSQTSFADKIKSFQSDLAASEKTLKLQFTNLRGSAPVRKPEIDSGEAALQKADAKAVAESLNKIYP